MYELFMYRIIYELHCNGVIQSVSVDFEHVDLFIRHLIYKLYMQHQVWWYDNQHVLILMWLRECSLSSITCLIFL